MSEAMAQPVQTTAQTTMPAPSKGLGARALGVFFSPRATYAEIVARPRALGALVAVIVIVAAATSAFLMVVNVR